MSDYAYVCKYHPHAQCLRSPSTGEWKIYDTEAGAYVALSASRLTEEAAWADAAETVRQRRTVKFGRRAGVGEL